MIGGQVGIGGHLKIGNRVQIQAKTGVLRNLKDGEKVMGYPALDYRFLQQILCTLQKSTEAYRNAS